jgi:hypothetical protein
LYGSIDRADILRAKRALNTCPELHCEVARGRGAQSRWYYIEDEIDGEE